MKIFIFVIMVRQEASWPTWPFLTADLQDATGRQDASKGCRQYGWRTRPLQDDSRQNNRRLRQLMIFFCQGSGRCKLYIKIIYIYSMLFHISFCISLILFYLFRVILIKWCGKLARTAISDVLRYSQASRQCNLYSKIIDILF